jgi:hypothetical protein
MLFFELGYLATTFKFLVDNDLSFDRLFFDTPTENFFSFDIDLSFFD